MKRVLLLCLAVIGLSLFSCKTNPSFVPEELRDLDGNTYAVDTFGLQIWMVENLRTTRYNDGSAIPLVTREAEWKGLTTAAYCWYNNDSIASNNAYGALYNGYAVQTGKVCPSGWRVPSDEDWTTLTSWIEDQGYGYLGSGDDISKAMASTTAWNASAKEGNVGSNPLSNNASGFNALPAGIHFSNGEFRHRGESAKWWSSTMTSAKSGKIRFLNWDLSTVSTYANSKKNGFSVRCVKDIDVLEESVPREVLPRKTNTATSSASAGSASASYSSVSWNDASAREFVLASFKDEGELSGFTRLLLEGKDLMLAMVQGASTAEVFEFEKKEEWEFVRRSAPFEFYPYMDYHFEKLAPGDFGLFVEHSEGAAGSSYGSKSIYAFAGEVFSEVFSITHRFPSMGEHRHGFIFNIVRTANGYYDIETFDNDNYEGDEYNEHHIYRYVFNGEKYVRRGRSENEHAAWNAERRRRYANQVVDYSCFEDDNLSLEEVEQLKKDFREGKGQIPYSSYSNYTYKMNFKAPCVDNSRGMEPEGVEHGIRRMYFMDSEQVCKQSSFVHNVVTEVTYFHPDGRVYYITKVRNEKPDGDVKLVDLENHVILQGKLNQGKPMGYWSTPAAGNFNVQDRNNARMYPGVFNMIGTLINFYEYDTDSRIFYMN